MSKTKSITNHFLTVKLLNLKDKTTHKLLKHGTVKEVGMKTLVVIDENIRKQRIK